MRLSRSALLYIAAGLCAIAAALFFVLGGPAGQGPAATVETTALAALREGDMKKLNFHSTPKPVSQAAFIREDGGDGRLSDYEGRFVLLNFWATWCAPCRKEMPMLAALQSEYGGERFEVVTLATGRNPQPAIEAFFEEIGVDNLPLHRDPKQAVAGEMGVLGLPITVIVDPHGREIARLQGEADWNSDSARALIKALIAPDADG